MNLEANILPYLNGNIRLSEKRPDILQVHLPFFHEDGDMYDIFVEPTENPKKIRVSDYGMTLLRLSYTFEVDTPTREKILNRIVYSNRFEILNGIVFTVVEIEKVYQAIMLLSQIIGKISNMKLYQRETIQNLFFEQLDQFIGDNLSMYYPDKTYYPISESTEYEVSYCFNHREIPLYLFAVNNPSNAKLATISCLKFRAEGIKFASIIVLENLDSVSKKDLSRLLSVSDKNFPTLIDFTENASAFFERVTNN